MLRYENNDCKKEEMKVLIYTANINGNGAVDRLAFDLACEISSKGIDTSILSHYRDALVLDSKLKVEANLAGINSIHCLRVPLFPNIIDVISSLFRLRNLIKNQGFNCVEVSGFGPSFLTAFGLFGLKIKVLIGIHAIFTTDQYSGFKYFIWKFILKVSKNISFYAVSKAAAVAWADYSGISSNRINIIHNSINKIFYDLPKNSENNRRFLNNLIGSSNDEICILFVGRLLLSKGVDTIYNALSPHLVLNEMHLIFVGQVEQCEGPKDARFIRGIIDEANNSPWRSRVHFLGQRIDIAKLMHGADLIVHPARREAFGLVLAEALAVGTPVIGTNVGGIPEVLEGTDSIIIFPDDEKGLLNSVISVIKRSKEESISSQIKGQLRANAFKPEIRATSIMNYLCEN
jgi:glycosyltransferase involved in cell wall biosynthesis